MLRNKEADKVVLHLFLDKPRLIALYNTLFILYM